MTEEMGRTIIFLLLHDIQRLCRLNLQLTSDGRMISGLLISLMILQDVNHFANPSQSLKKRSGTMKLVSAIE